MSGHLRYRLDDLGWFHFECLVQSLLKAELGLGVESWGDHSDDGRDSYAKGPLEFPVRGRATKGPFVFQSKYVESANAAGAKPSAPLLKAVKAEANRIHLRMKSSRWLKPRIYVLLTNVPLTSVLRGAIEEILSGALPTTQVLPLGGRDLCDLLDRQPILRRAFPELLSLRDLDALLHEVVSKTILERSRSAIEETRDVVPVFVPTRAYDRGWQILRKHSFLVLDGPPEMGKTAIARMIALAQLTSGWQAIDCRNPDDFFGSFHRPDPQIFVADDAFGRTEYDPTMGRVWERDLSRVLQHLNSRHWLIWTARKHILNRALKEMDLAGKASKFPEPGEIVVTADDLTIEEKSRMLYRHAKAAKLVAHLRQIVRDHAELVVRDKHFTPERIRRFISDTLPQLVHKESGQPLSRDRIVAQVAQAIRDPTVQTRKSYRKLTNAHRWLLISLLECNDPVSIDILRDIFEKRHQGTSKVAFQEALDDLLGTFIKMGPSPWAWIGDQIGWIHPSYRDLVIDELSSDGRLLTSFLKQLSLRGIMLALSQAGGVSGSRLMPFMGSRQAWRSLSGRCIDIAHRESPETVSELLDILISAVSSLEADDPIREEAQQVMREVCTEARRRWDSASEPIAPSALESYAKAVRLLEPPPPFPSFAISWEAAYMRLRSQMAAGGHLEPRVIRDWSKLLGLRAEYDSPFFDSEGTREQYKDDRNKLLLTLESELDRDPSDDDPEVNDGEADRLLSLARAIEDLPPAPDFKADAVDELVGKLESQAAWCREHGVPIEGDASSEDTSSRSKERAFDIKGLFSDL